MEGIRTARERLQNIGKKEGGCRKSKLVDIFSVANPYENCHFLRAIGSHFDLGVIFLSIHKTKTRCGEYHG